MTLQFLSRVGPSVCGCPVQTPVNFMKFFPGNRNHHHFSDDAGCHELQLVCHCEVGHCEVEDEDEDAACGFHRGSLCNAAIQSCDQHSNRSFLLLRIADFVVDAVDVVDVAVSEFVLFPPGGHLALSGIVSMRRQILVAVEEVFWCPSAFKQRTQCLAFCSRSARVAV